MKKIRVLNLYAGIGGNRKLWPDNVEVTAVEYDGKIAEAYLRNFPQDKVVIADAHQYLLEHAHEFDFIWSSPPCQSHSQMNKASRHVGKIKRYPDMKLYQEILWLKHFFKGLWVVENVNPYYDPLIPAEMVDRHLFWANFPIGDFTLEHPSNLTKMDKEALQKWLGMRLEENIYVDGNHCNRQVLRNCVHPKLGEHVFKSAYKIKQQTLTF